jgi:hypothetical protein
MGIAHAIPITNKVDIHAARMYTRQVAREVGMDLITQARVSLSTSTLAHALRMGDEKAGTEKIIIEAAQNGERSGVRITFIARVLRAQEEVRFEILKDLHPDDELEFQLLSTGQVKVTLLVWTNTSFQDSASAI